MTIEFRAATSEDIEIVQNFERQLILFEQSIEPSLKPDNSYVYYDIPALVNKPSDSIVLIITIDGKPIGCGLAEKRTNDPCYINEIYGYIGLMYIEPKYRGNGLSKLLLSKLSEWLKNQDVKEIRLKVYSSNINAIRAYETSGFRHYIHEMKLSPIDK